MLNLIPISPLKGFLKTMTTENTVSLQDALQARKNSSDLDRNIIKSIIDSGNKILIADTYMKIRDVKNQINDNKVIFQQKLNFMFSGTNEQIDILATRASEVTEEALKSATFEELKEFFMFDGEFVGLQTMPGLKDEDMVDAYRDFLLYLREMDSAEKDLNEYESSNDELMDLFPEEVKEAAQNTYTWDRYIYKIFKEKMEDENTPPEEKETLQKIIVMKDSALNLEPMKEYMRNEMNAGRRKSMINAFRTRFKDTLQKADQYASANKFKMYYPLYDNIEETIGYEGYQNLFVYILARYVKFCSENFNKYDNVYIAQIIQNLIMLKKGQLDEASRIMMSNAIKDILNILLLEE